MEKTYFFKGLAILLTLSGVLSPPETSAKESNKSNHETAMSEQDKIDVTVIVKDAKGAPIIGATVILDGNNTKGNISGLDGGALISDISPDGSITVSMLGMKPQTIAINGRTSFVVALQEDAINIDEIVVVGYGSQKKSNLTGAVSQVKMDDVLGDRPVASVGAALQGAIPGLVITGNAEPGSNASFNIRGTTSINGGSPLILIDNVPGDVNMLNPEDIESVSVLKDAASTAIYGARAAFGVILITTKKVGTNTRLTLNYNNSISFEKAYNLPEQASVREIIQSQLDYSTDGKYFAQSQDLQQWLGYIDEYESGTLTTNYPNSYFNQNNGVFVQEGTDIAYYLKDNDPQQGMLDNFGFQQKHNISAQGGGDKITYRLSLGYIEKDGIFVTDKDKFDRINVNSFVKADITDWLSTSLDFRYAKRNRSFVDSGVFVPGVARFEVETMPFTSDLEGGDYPTDVPHNHLQYNTPKTWLSTNSRVYSQTVITPFKGFTGVVEYTYDEDNNDTQSYKKNWEYITLQQGSLSGTQPTPLYEKTKSFTAYNAINAYASYDIASTDKNHNFKLMAGFSQESSYYEELKVSRKDVINPDMPSINGSVGEILASDKFNEYAIRGGFFRFNYNYKDKYLLEANGRYDGSSKFPKANRFGFFPSASIGWQVGKEAFMESTKSWLGEFKLRASWGQVGNQAINNYMFIPEMGIERADWLIDGSKPASLQLPSLVRSNFTWESVETVNLGADLSFLNNRLQVTAEWYNRATKGMLAPGMELPSVVGAAAPTQNVADLATKGWEFSANWRDKVGEVNYSVGFNIYDSQTEITSYNNAGGLLSFKNDGKTSSKGQLDNYYQGQILGDIWGYQNDGYYTINDFKDGWQDGKWNLKDGVTSIRGNNNIRPGDIKFKNTKDDENSKNEIYSGLNTLDNHGDRSVIGNSTPRYQYGINLSADYKGFGLSLFMNGTGQRDVWVGGEYMFPMSGGTFGTLYSNQLDYWTPTERGGYTPVNANPEFGRIYDNAKAYGSNYRVQDKYLLDASYFRLKNVTLSYSVPKKAISKIGISALKVFFSGENLLTIDHLPKGFDPERIDWGYPYFTSYSLGLSITL